MRVAADDEAQAQPPLPISAKPVNQNTLSVSRIGVHCGDIGEAVDMISSYILHSAKIIMLIQLLS